MTITRLGMCYDYQAAPHAMEQSDRVWNEKSIQRCLKTLLLMITGFFRTIKILFVPNPHSLKYHPYNAFQSCRPELSANSDEILVTTLASVPTWAQVCGAGICPNTSALVGGGGGARLATSQWEDRR